MYECLLSMDEIYGTCDVYRQFITSLTHLIIKKTIAELHSSPQNSHMKQKKTSRICSLTLH